MTQSVQRTVARRMLVVGAGTFLSRCLGLARDVVFAQVWGTGVGLAAFLVAFAIPNLLRGLFGEGAFSAAFVPVFSEVLEKEGEAAAWHRAVRVLSVLAVGLSLLVLLAASVAIAIRPLFTGELPRLVLQLLPWLLPYAVMICLSAALAGVLNSLHRFAVPAFSQLLLNAFLIGASFAAASIFGASNAQRVWGLVVGVLLAGGLQLRVHMLACKSEIRTFRFQFSLRDPAVRRIAILMGPAVIGAGVVQLNVLVDKILAMYLGEVAVTTLYYSQRLVYLPVGLFGVAASTVSLPSMSRAWARGDRSDLLSTLRASLAQVLFWAIPAWVLLSVLCVPTIRLLFERGSFGSHGTAETAWALLFYLPGIPAFAAAKILIAPFHARQDTRTPVRIAVVCLVLNVILNLSLMPFLRQGGLALATTVCSYLNVLLLILALRRHVGELGVAALVPRLLRMGIAALGAFWSAWQVSAWTGGSAADLTGRMIEVALPAVVGGAVYLGIASLLKSPELTLPTFTRRSP